MSSAHAAGSAWLDRGGSTAISWSMGRNGLPARMRRRHIVRGCERRVHQRSSKSITVQRAPHRARRQWARTHPGRAATTRRARSGTDRTTSTTRRLQGEDGGTALAWSTTRAGTWKASMTASVTTSLKLTLVVVLVNPHEALRVRPARQTNDGQTTAAPRR